MPGFIGILEMLAAPAPAMDQYVGHVCTDGISRIRECHVRAGTPPRRALEALLASRGRTWAPIPC